MMAHNTNRKAASSEKERSGWIKVWLISAVAQESDLLPGNVCLPFADLLERSVPSAS